MAGFGEAFGLGQPSCSVVMKLALRYSFQRMQTLK